MKVFKFGGASVKDAASVKNVATILSEYKNEKLFVVISAMGKTTNALEEFTNSLYHDIQTAKSILVKIKSYHFEILNELFKDPNHIVFNEIHNAFVELDWMLDEIPAQPYDHTYDQVVSLGEILSTKIISHFLNYIGVNNTWIDVRDFMRTDNNYREAKVDWNTTQSLFDLNMDNYFKKDLICITQGFIGGTSENFTTTLGREGSDYTASIIAYLCNAEQVTIWKDVAGVMNADPKKFNDAVLLPHLTYHDAVELTYYGATVIHPKTIKPIQNKHIPLYVRSFINYHETGTEINDTLAQNVQACFIHKPDQLLLSLSGKDFSFIVEDSISKIFGALASLRIKVNLMQNSALSFSICIDNFSKKNILIDLLSSDFFVRYNEGIDLYTIRHYNQKAIEKIMLGKEVLLEQRSRNTLQLVVKKSD
ncbi:MAG TPA: aspartate kinase [Bacteroidia bacterium]|nr:aspartate kinase [Bacteroidia bacterium]